MHSQIQLFLYTDVSIQWTKCKHIHLVSQAQKLYLAKENEDKSQTKTRRERSDIDLKEDKTYEESLILSAVSGKFDCSDHSKVWYF